MAVDVRADVDVVCDVDLLGNQDCTWSDKDSLTDMSPGLAIERHLEVRRQSAEGLLVSANDFTIEDLAIEDTKGDALKINQSRNVTIRRVRTEWTNGASTENGAYGIYPVQSENILIEGSVAIGASDAGIYVGQSKNIVVRDSRAEYNVAGIEIENSTHAHRRPAQSPLYSNSFDSRIHSGV